MRRRLFGICPITVLLMATTSIGFASINLNSSKSNIYRLVHSSHITPAQATAIGAELDKTGRGADERTVQGILMKLGVKTGCGKGCVNHVKVYKSDTILILENRADEAQAIALSDKEARKQSKQ